MWTSGGVEVCSATGSRVLSGASADGSGGVFLVWDDLRGGAAYDVYAARVAADGTAPWTSDGVEVCGEVNEQSGSALLPDSQGGVFVAWADSRDSGSNQEDVYLQRLDSDGNEVWTAGGIPVGVLSVSEQSPVLAADAADGAFVCWESNVDIYAQRINAEGNEQWTAGGVGVCTNGSTQMNPLAISDGAGGVIVAWLDMRAIQSEFYAQRMDPSGGPLWAADGVNLTGSSDDEEHLDMISDGQEGAIVIFADYSNYYTHAQRINSDGDLEWPAGGVQVFGTADDAKIAKMAPDGEGGAVVVRQMNETSGGDDDIYAQRLDAGGNLLWTSGGVEVCTAANHQQYPVVAWDGCGGVVVAWVDDRSGTGSYSVYVQRLSMDGVAQWAENGVEVAGGFNSNLTIRIASDGQCGVVLAYGDDTTLYAQRLRNPAFVAGVLPMMLQ